MSFRRIAALPRPLRFALGLTVGAILYATLQPAAVADRTPPWWCVACGDLGRADFLLNVILFIPLGSVLRFTGARLRTAILSGLLLSVFIELTQAFIPGRDTTLGDVISNTLGAAAGFACVALLVTAARRTWRPPIPTGLSVGAALGIIALTGVALHPSFPPSIYYGQWTADLGGGLEWYRGHIVRATVGTTPLPSRELDHQDAVRALLDEGAPLEVTAVAGPPPDGIAPLFSIYDDREREILMLAPRGTDLVIRFRTRSISWGLDHPYLTLAGALDGVRAGDSLTVKVWRQAGRLCVLVNHRRSCTLGFTAGAGWSILIYPESFGWWVRALLDGLWVGGILLPAGFFATSRNALIGAAAVTALGLAVLPGAVGLIPTTAWEWIAAVLALAGGRQVRRLLGHRPPAQPARAPQIVFTNSARQRSIRS